MYAEVCLAKKKKIKRNFQNHVPEKEEKDQKKKKKTNKTQAKVVVIHRSNVEKANAVLCRQLLFSLYGTFPSLFCCCCCCCVAALTVNCLFLLLLFKGEKTGPNCLRFDLHVFFLFFSFFGSKKCPYVCAFTKKKKKHGSKESSSVCDSNVLLFL